MTEERRVLLFRRLARAGALLAACVVVLGAWVRLTAAGLGCPDWPGCYGHLFPQTTQRFAEAVHEMVHRYFASTLGAIIVALLVWAFLNRRARGQPLAAVAVLLFLVCVQGLLGMKTVTLLLQPLIVTAHLLGGLTTLALLWWLSLVPRSRPLTHPELSCANLHSWPSPRSRCRSRSAAGPAATTRRSPARICRPASTPGGRTWISATPSFYGAGSASTTKAACSPAGPRRHPFHAPVGRGDRGLRIARRGLRDRAALGAAGRCVCWAAS